MHETAYEAGGEFFKIYWREGFKNILDIGSTNFNGTLRDFCPEGAEFIGVDLSPGESVDLVLEDPYILPFEDEHFDCIISTSCFEHDEMFWLTFLECCRVISKHGFIYINAPSGGPYHGYPGDQWRFYPDASLALAKWSQRMNQPVHVVESFIAYRSENFFNDNIMIFSKDKTYRPAPFLADIFEGAQDVRRAPRVPPPLPDLDSLSNDEKDALIRELWPHRPPP